MWRRLARGRCCITLSRKVLRAATRDVVGDEFVELRLVHREHRVHLGRLVCIIAKRFFLLSA